MNCERDTANLNQMIFYVRSMSTAMRFWTDRLLQILVGIEVEGQPRTTSSSGAAGPA